MRAAALAAAVAAAALIPGKPLGVGVLLVAGLIALTVVVGCRVSRGAYLYGALALALAAQAMLLDAAWVVALDLVAACALAAVAVCGPRLSSLAAPLVRLGDAPQLAPPLPAGLGAIARGSALGILVVTPFTLLFLVGDKAFLLLGERLPLPPTGAVPGQVAAFAVVLVGAVGLTLAARRPYRHALSPPGRRLSPWEWALPLALLDALFLVFVCVQLAVLFGGHDRILETHGLTYAEYAREGYFELITAAALTLVVIGAVAFLAEAPRRAHRVLQRALIGLLGALTLVVIASALHRLRLYEQAYGLTRLRLFAGAGAIWLAGVFVVIGAAGLLRPVRRRAAHVLVAGTALGLLAFSLANPDRIVAQQNVDLWRETGEIDTLYLAELSADAAPALAGLPSSFNVLDQLRGTLAEDEPWSSYNVSRSRARALLD